jgi:hypothetical protein
MFGENYENIFPNGWYIFKFLLADGFDGHLINEDYVVRFVYKGTFLEHVIDSFKSIKFIDDKLNVIYCIYLIFLTYGKTNLDAKVLFALSRLVVCSVKILIKIDGGEYAGNNKIENVKEFNLLNDKQKRDFLLVNFVKFYKMLIYRLIIKKEFFGIEKEFFEIEKELTQLQTDHANVISDLFHFFKEKGITNSILNDLALTILMWNINKPLDIYHEFILLFFILY